MHLLLCGRLLYAYDMGKWSCLHGELATANPYILTALALAWQAGYERQAKNTASGIKE